MDAAHPNHAGQWDPNSFAAETPWDQQFAFSSEHGPENAYHNPGAFIDAPQQVAPQLAGHDSQTNAYGAHYEYYPQNEAWTGPSPAAAPYAQEPLTQDHYAPAQQHPQHTQHQQQNPYGNHRTIDSRFALVDLPQETEYQNHHMQIPERQEVVQGGFGHGAVPSRQQSADGYLQGHVSEQWQRVPMASSGYPANGEYQNPLAMSQSVNQQPAVHQQQHQSQQHPQIQQQQIQRHQQPSQPRLHQPQPQQQQQPLQRQTPTPTPYQASHGPIQGGLPNYHHVQGHHTPEPQPNQAHFMQPINGQHVQNRASVAQLPMQRTTASPSPLNHTPIQSAPIQPKPVQAPPQQPIQPKLAPRSMAQPTVQPMVQPAVQQVVQTPVHQAAHPSHSTPQPTPQHTPQPTPQPQAQTISQVPQHHQTTPQQFAQHQQPSQSQGFQVAVSQSQPVQIQSFQVPAQERMAQAQTTQQTIQSPQTNVISGVKRPGDVQEMQTLAKKPKVLQPASSAANPQVISFANTNSANSGVASDVNVRGGAGEVASPFTVDEDLIDKAIDTPGCTVPGVPHLVIDETPVQLKKGPPTKRFVTIVAKAGKDPLFPGIERGWTPAESLSNHAEAYQTAKEVLDRQRADIRLDIEMKRAKTELPADWWRKLSKGELGTDAKQRGSPPPEPILTAVKASELLRVHPAHKKNRKFMSHTSSEFGAFVADKVAALRAAPAFEKLVKDVKSKGKGPATLKPAAVEALKQSLEPLKTELEAAITEGLKVGDPVILRMVGEKGVLPVRLLNLLIQLFNLNEATSSLAKAALRLFGCFTSLTPEQLEAWKFQTTKAKLEGLGDPEVNELVATIIANAEKNAGKEGPPAKSKKEANSDTKKTPAKATVSTTKRAREDDTNGDSRTAKKPFTDAKSRVTTTSNSVNSVKAPSTGSKASPPTTKPALKSSASTTAATTVKPRASYLLPGKTRPAAKPASKPEPTKPEPAKPLVKTEAPKPSATLSAVKSNATQAASSAGNAAKAAKPKEEPSSSSRFAALMEEIAAPKKVNVDETPPAESAPDPNETEEQRKRRLRKEERRRLNLRVNFKSEDQLCQIKEYNLFPEEMGHRQSRDVRSDSKDKREGMALKKGHAGEIRPWEEPNSVDLDVLPEEVRKERYVTVGGSKTFRTEQQAYMEDREAKELMVIYTDPSDIPPTPKSPAYEPSLDDGSGSDIPLPAGLEYDELRRRATDLKKIGPYRSASEAKARLEAQSAPGYADFAKAMKSLDAIAAPYAGYPMHVPQPAVVHAAPVISAKPEGIPPIIVPVTYESPEVRDQWTYEVISSERARYYCDPEPYDPAHPKTVRRRDYPDPVVQKAADFIEEIVEYVKRTIPEIKQQPAPAVPVVPAQAPAPAQAAQPAAAPVDYSAAWAQYYAQQAQQGQQPDAHALQQQQAWYAHQQQQQQLQQQQQPSPINAAYQQIAELMAQGADVTPILTALANQANANPQQAAEFQALLASLANAGQQQQPSQPANPQAAEWLAWAAKSGAGGQGAGAHAQPAGQHGGYDPYQGDQAYNDHNARDSRDRDLNSRDRDHENWGNTHGGGRDNFRDRNESRDGGRDSRDGRDGQQQHHRDNKPHWKKKNRDRNGDEVPDHLKGINRSLIGTKQCSFWAQGKCAKGDKCTFRHD